MTAFLPKRKRWPLLAVLALIVVFATEAAVQGQRGGPGPRPVPRPMQPAPRQVNPQNVPGRPPVMPGPGAARRTLVWITVYRCSRCNGVLSNGAAPTMAVCPFCGCQFAGNPVVASREQVPGDGLFAGMNPTLLYTAGTEGSLLAGIVLLGVIRLGIGGLRGRGLPTEDGIESAVRA